MSGLRVTTTAEVSMELGTYGAERQEELHAALDRLADASAIGAGTPDGVGWYAELLPGMAFHWVVLEQPRLAIVWQIVLRN
ncbi:hypothetical protein [Streptomyces sp. NBC_01190]|uniref:hypothetical protein n=1 Tax=Streptomyces sp. NBC_01190 TaxID=2903767 RepID=UPI00386CB91B|nr:hypothetical protein OG519_14055 [Streptomyces sp. NBC_01190]